METKTGYILFFDILGYKNLIRYSSDTDLDGLKKYLDLIDQNNLKPNVSLCLGAKYNQDKFFFKAFSDNFLILYEEASPCEATLAMIISLATLIQGQGIIRGFLLRGSISFGDIELNKSIVFGKNIVSAYELEESHNVPSVVLSKELEGIYESSKFKDCDLFSPFSFSQQGEGNFGPEFLRGISLMIERLNQQKIVDRKTIKKYKWLVYQFNKRSFAGINKIKLLKTEHTYSIIPL